jgi:hypothetical protein
VTSLITSYISVPCKDFLGWKFDNHSHLDCLKKKSTSQLSLKVTGQASPESWAV